MDAWRQLVASALRDGETFKVAQCQLASGQNFKHGFRCMTVEAVIWDFGGVFTTSPFEAFARYEAEKG